MNGFDTNCNMIFESYKKQTRKTKYVYKSHSLIKNVIFNDPATIVFWNDGTKTVVKVNANEDFDPEKGLAMAISKKMLGNKSNYYNEFKKWLPKEEKEEEKVTLEDICNNICNTIAKLSETIINQATIKENTYEPDKLINEEIG